MVCQEFQRQQVLKSLYNCAQVSRSWAGYALPLLYRYQDTLPSFGPGYLVGSSENREI